MFNSILLALSVSIDSLGIGITYGIKDVKFYFWSKCILFTISIIFTSCSFLLGNFINSILSEVLTKTISSIILVIIGIIILSDPIPFDFNNSKGIDLKESLFLGIALSLDSIGIGIGSSIGGYLNIYFSIFSHKNSIWQNMEKYNIYKRNHNQNNLRLWFQNFLTILDRLILFRYI